MSDPHSTSINKENSLHSNLSFFSFRAKHTQKYLFCFIFIILLSIPLFFINPITPLLKAIGPGFSFTAGGDIGGNRKSSTTLDLVAQSGSNFHLAIGDLSYSEI